MEEQNKQNLENEEIETNEEVQETKPATKKATPKMAIINASVALAIVAMTVVFITLLGGNNGNQGNSNNSNNNSTHTHAYGNWIPVKSATCTNSGTKERHCSCGEKIAETIPATGHSYGDWFVSKKATCNESGMKIKQCHCGETQSQSISATGHDEGTWIVEKESTCTEDGKKINKCNRCQTIMESIVLPSAHKYVNEVCSVCGKGVFNIVIPNTPHNIDTTFSTYYTKTSATINSIKYKIEENFRGDGTYDITFYYDGEKTYDINGSDSTDSCRIAFRLYDSEGYLIDWVWTSESVKVGDKFKGDVTLYNVALDKQKTYRIEINGNP